MAKDTTTDRVRFAALQYGDEWEHKDLDEKNSKFGFPARELLNEKELDASKKTVIDRLLTMEEQGLFSGVGGNGGEPRYFSRRWSEDIFLELTQ